jgi:hypothetical protein
MNLMMMPISSSNPNNPPSPPTELDLALMPERYSGSLTRPAGYWPVLRVRSMAY